MVCVKYVKRKFCVIYVKRKVCVIYVKCVLDYLILFVADFDGMYGIDKSMIMMNERYRQMLSSDEHSIDL